MKTIVTSNSTKIAARYRRMARNMPGIVQGALRDLVTQEAIPLFQATTRSWTNDPTFTAAQTARGWQVEIDPAFPFQWVNKGTRVRYAFMSKDWKSKTKPNVLASFKGRGRVLFISRKRPMPGIQARNFTDIVMKRVQARAANKVREALNEASYGAGTGI
jgi:hypothetical protein